MSALDEKYTIRRAESDDDGQRLNELFSAVFHPSDVGTLAETIFRHFPRMKREYWFIAEEKETQTIVSGFSLLPWTLELEGLELKVAEMGIVGTLEEHRKRGLMKRLNQEFDRTLAGEEFDLSIIQGIPGFYHQFGFHYSIPLENHINIPFHLLPDELEEESYTFRLANVEDIPFLIEEDSAYRKSFSLSSLRDEAVWRYMLTESGQTEYGSEFWIGERKDGGERFYCRIPKDGFGNGLIVSEISEDIGHDALNHLFFFCKQKALERDKPYIRLNLHNESTVGKIAIAMGAPEGKPYAWQIKIPDKARYLKKIAPVLEKRMAQSPFPLFSEAIRLDFFRSSIDLTWEKGKLASVEPGEGDCPNTFSMTEEWFSALALGHRSWRELRHIQPSIFPSSEKTALLIETLFPTCKSWIHEQY
ncbi:MAG: GNAT family N-acetyltransferase [Gemmatimonadetes bacterium]|jgi:predicted N-acetyltransferase YhbS|nr:GNAT family N-acetyltransferase [Gemmatimonadota bacterium]